MTQLVRVKLFPTHPDNVWLVLVCDPTSRSGKPEGEVVWILVHCRCNFPAFSPVAKRIGQYPFILQGGKRESKLSFSGQEPNAMSPARARTQTA